MKHNNIDYAKTLISYKNENLCLKGEKVVLVEGAKEGYLESDIIKTDLFDITVGSWACITDQTRTCELQVRVCVEGKWSKYFTYGNWGLYLENYYYNDEDEIAQIFVDEVMIKNGKKGEAIQYKVILRKEAEKSPELSLICFNFRYKPVDSMEVAIDEGVDVTGLPMTVEYDVPRLNQNMVPVIGHEMCSATTSCMLLKFHGLDFSENAKNYKHKDSWGEFEHSYVASLVADPGHNMPTFGNWVYNTAVIGAFGFNAYVGRMGSWEEMKRHLAKVGPVGASIKGDTGVYKTGGHLLVVIGYKKNEKGEEFVICNDPNINERFGEGMFVRVEYPLEVFKKVWRGMAYIIE